MASRKRELVIRIAFTGIWVMAGAGCYETQKLSNWYYYWEKDGVIPPLDSGGSPASRWSPRIDYFGAAASGYDGIVVTDLCIIVPDMSSYHVEHKNNVTLQWDIGAETKYGIQQVAATVAHEQQHIVNAQQKAVDNDDDGLDDGQEGKPPYYFDTSLPDTYDLENAISDIYAGYGDDEFLARVAEVDAVAAQDLTEDWSWKGAQWRQ